MQKRVATVVSLILLHLCGCATIKSLTQGIEKPTAQITGAHLADLSLQSASINFDVQIHNPYPVSLPLVNAQYALAGGSSGQPLVSGSADLQGAVPARSSKQVTLPAKIVFAQLLRTVTEIKPGGVLPYRADLTLSVNAPELGSLQLPLQHTGMLPIPTAPDVSLSSIQWKTLGLSKAEAVLNLNIANRNEFPFNSSNLSLQLALSGTPVVSAQAPTTAALEPGGQQALQIPISFSPRDLGLAIMDVLRGQSSSYSLSGAMEAATPYGPMSLPYQTAGTVSLR